MHKKKKWFLKDMEDEEYTGCILLYMKSEQVGYITFKQIIIMTQKFVFMVVIFGHLGLLYGV